MLRTCACFRDRLLISKTVQSRQLLYVEGTLQNLLYVFFMECLLIHSPALSAFMAYLSHPLGCRVGRSDHYFEHFRVVSRPTPANTGSRGRGTASVLFVPKRCFYAARPACLSFMGSVGLRMPDQLAYADMSADQDRSCAVTLLLGLLCYHLTAAWELC